MRRNIPLALLITLIILFFVTLFLTSALDYLITPAYADAPDTDQNSGSNNIAYDLPNKWYAGLSFGYTYFLADTITINSQSETLSVNGINFGVLGGYKFNDYVALEMDAYQLGHITSSSNNSSQSFSYDARVDNASVDLLGSYELLLSDDQYFRQSRLWHGYHQLQQCHRVIIY